MITIPELVSSSKDRLWKRGERWAMYMSRYEEFIGIKCKPIVDSIVEEYGSPYEESTAAILFAVLDKNFLDSNFTFLTSCSKPLCEYFYIVALNDFEALLNDERIHLSVGELLPIKRYSKFECLDNIAMISGIEILPSGFNLARIIDSDNLPYMTYEQMIKEIER